jgi:ParB family chromosome partitioning protein
VQIPVESIIVRHRLRRELGDIDGLMESLRKHGQLAPILVNRRHELIAGFRRLEAARRLGWTAVKVEIVDSQSDTDRLELEIEENVQRQDLSQDEVADGLQRLNRLRNPGLLRRIWLFLCRLVRKVLGRRA